MPEFQGGAFDPWGGPGYNACAVLTGPDFQDVFYKHNWAANVKLVSYYMFYGCVRRAVSCVPSQLTTKRETRAHTYTYVRWSGFESAGARAGAGSRSRGCTRATTTVRRSARTAR